MSWAKAAAVRVRRWVWRVLGVLREFGARVARRAAGWVEVVVRRAPAPVGGGLVITLSASLGVG